jgi:hypothetical protein
MTLDRADLLSTRLNVRFFFYTTLSRLSPTLCRKTTDIESVIFSMQNRRFTVIKKSPIYCRPIFWLRPVEITVVSIVITIVRVKITMRVEITLFMYE